MFSPEEYVLNYSKLTSNSMIQYFIAEIRSRGMSSQVVEEGIPTAALFSGLFLTLIILKWLSTIFVFIFSKVFWYIDIRESFGVSAVPIQSSRTPPSSQYNGWGNWTQIRGQLLFHNIQRGESSYGRRKVLQIDFPLLLTN